MAIKFYCDEHIPLSIAKALKRRGVDILTAQEAGLMGMADEKHLQLAVSQARTIITQDTNFLRIHGTGTSHQGIVFAHQGTSIGEFIQGIILIYQVLSEQEMKNHVEYL